jgi:hypothetical protein
MTYLTFGKSTTSPGFARPAAAKRASKEGNSGVAVAAEGETMAASSVCWHNVGGKPCKVVLGPELKRWQGSGRWGLSVLDNQLESSLMHTSIGAYSGNKINHTTF